MQETRRPAGHVLTPNTRMTGADSFFLSIENEQCPMNMGLLLILEGDSDEALVERVVETMSADTPLSLSLRRKLKRSPGNIDHPVWVDNPDFHVQDHILRHDLPAPGGITELNRLVAQIIPSHMPDNKPMWEFHIVRGLQNQRTAIILKLHHAYADGTTGVLIMQQVLDKDGIRNKRRLALDTIRLDNENSQDTDASDYSPLRFFRQLGLTLLMNAGLRLFICYQFMLKQRVQAKPAISPPTRFNQLISSERSYSHGAVSMNEMREITNRFRCTRNDVFLAIISGALRRYLAEMGELPSRSLYAGLPLTLLADDKRSKASNQLSFYRSSLATNIADPVERLETIKFRLNRSTRMARGDWKKRLLERLTQAPPKATQGVVKLYLRLLKKGLLRPNFNVFTTLMPGPARPVTIAGAKISGIHPVSIPYHGAGLFISAIRYCDEIHYGIVGDREQLPKAEILSQMVQSSFKELLDRARQPASK